MSNDICVLLGLRIRELRKQRGWRQIDLAEHSGISETYLSNVEHGRKELCLRNLQVLAATLECSLSELLRGL